MPHARPNEWQIEAEVVDAMRASDCGCTCDALLKCTRFAEEELRHLYASPPAATGRYAQRHVAPARVGCHVATWRGWLELRAAVSRSRPHWRARVRVLACGGKAQGSLQQLPRQ
jgi:hypothetical protein